MRVLSALGVLIISGRVFATTWVPETVQDPISGTACSVHLIASYGSYIYSWPSKYDGVYWPHTDPNDIWFCAKSGYTSFANDFEELTPKETDRIREYLAKHYVQGDGEVSALQRLALLETIYGLRDKDDAFWGWFKRVKAVQLEGLATRERMQAIPLLEKEVAALPPGFELVQKLYVLGDYYRLRGDDKRAVEYFDRSKAVKWTDEEGKEQVGSPYINAIIDERTRLLEPPH